MSRWPLCPTMMGRTFLDRRGFLQQSATGLGAIALAQLLQDDGVLATIQSPLDRKSPIHPNIVPASPHLARRSHYPPKAKNVLVVFCCGAISHIDTFDYKSALIKKHDQPMPGGQDLITFQGEQGNLIRSPWKFKPRGQSGKMISDLLPNLAELADDMCFVHSMTSKTNSHGPGETFMSTGFTLEGFPSMGAWISYALGTENQQLPAFVAIPDPRGVPQASINNWGSGFLPAAFQGTAFNAMQPVPNLSRPATIPPDTDLDTRNLLEALNTQHLKRFPHDTELSARIASYELAGQLQRTIPEVADLSRESDVTLQMYGVYDSNDLKAGYARNCLLARRLLERGVRFVEVFNGAYQNGGEGLANWDGHKTILKHYSIHGPILDQPTAALLRDLKLRGLLEETLVVFTTEFGRMPTFQKGASGRDHNPKGFTAWLAGAGVKKGFSYGETDEFGYKSVKGVTTVYDLHATILHLLGLNHERLSFYHNGIQRRLTDVHGHVIKPILA